MLGQKAYKILFITLSNIGDCILTLPVLDLLSLSFAESEITVMVAPRPKEIFLDNPMIKQVIIYDKKSSLKAKIDLFNTLKRENFDIVVDLKNTLFGQLLPAAFKAHHFLRKPKQISHMRDVHLSKILYPSLDLSQTWNLERRALYLKAGDLRYIENLLKENGISENDKVIVVSAGARSQIKRWPKEKFADLINKLGEGLKSKIILIGDQDDIPISKYITQKVKIPLLDITGKTSILQRIEIVHKGA
jgi:heptosyltransferase-3